MKTCFRCEIEKPFDHYHKDRTKPDGYYSVCKSCRSERLVAAYATPEGKKKVVTRYNKRAEAAKRRHVEYMKEMHRTDPAFRLLHNLRTRHRLAILGKSRRGSAVRDLGCTGDEARVHIESLFHDRVTGERMTWSNNNLSGWQIDHIVEYQDIDVEDPDQLRRVTHYTNLQPLWKEEHDAKRRRRRAPAGP